MATSISRTSAQMHVDTTGWDRGFNTAEGRLDKFTSNAKRQLKSFSKDAKGILSGDLMGGLGGGLGMLGGGPWAMALTAAGAAAVALGSTLSDKVNKRLEETRQLAEQAAKAISDIADQAFKEGRLGESLNLLTEGTKKQAENLGALQQEFNDLTWLDSGWRSFTSGFGMFGTPRTESFLREEIKQAQEAHSKLLAQSHEQQKPFTDSVLSRFAEDAFKLAEQQREAEERKREAIDKATQAIEQQNRVRELGAAEAARLALVEEKASEEQIARRIKAIQVSEALIEREQLLREQEQLRERMAKDKGDTGRMGEVHAVRSFSNEGARLMSRMRADLEQRQREGKEELDELKKQTDMLKGIEDRLGQVDLIVKGG